MTTRSLPSATESTKNSGAVISLEGVAQAGEQTTTSRVGIGVGHRVVRRLLASQLREFAQQPLLLFIELRRRLNVEMHMEVTPADAAREMRHASSAQRHDRAGSRAWLDRQRLGAVKGVEVDDRAER